MNNKYIQILKDHTCLRYSRFSLLFFLFSMVSFGQDYIDLGRVFYSITPQNTFDEGSGSTSIQEFGFQIDIPLVLNEKNALLAGVFGNRTDLRLNPLPTEMSRLYAVGVKVGLNQTFNEKWSATYLLFPKMATDFSSGFSRGFQLGLLALISQTKTKKLKYSYGLFYNSEEFGPLLVPLLGIYYKSPNNLFEANILLPVLADMNYALGKKTKIGGNFDGIGTSYAISTTSFPNAYANKNTNELFAYFEYQLTPSLYIRFKTGYTFFRSYRVFDEDDKVSLSISSIYFGDNRTILNTDFEDGFIFKAVLRYRFNLLN